MPTHDDFVFPTYEQISNLAEGLQRVRHSRMAHARLRSADIGGPSG